MVIVWDEPKRERNFRIHGIDFADIRDAFAFETAGYVESYGNRIVATGLLRGAMLTVVFRPLGREGISIISARPASRKERRAYDLR